MSIISALTDFSVTLVTFSGRMKRVEKKQDEIVVNYLNRFDEVKDRIRESEMRILTDNQKRHEHLIELMNKASYGL